jgi:hypothetical protein
MPYEYGVLLASGNCCQYWEYVEDSDEGKGEDTQTDPSVSG